mmetsp:Transcript_7076/g.8061  ORF Transcript_7076/g.8061 Transcript_7076/m.8061 type:complete len:157 (-) Transcript_7076:231-701(-)
MGRGRRGGGGGGGGGMFGRSKPAARKPVPATRPAAQVPAKPQSSGGGMMSGLGSTIAQGMAFGTGSAIAHQAVGAIMGSGSSGSGGTAPAEQQQQMETQPFGQQQQQQQQLQGACGQDKQMFFECLQINRGDQQACSFLYETLQTCQRNDTQMQYS